MPTTSFMGGEVRRREDPRLITGSASYVDDIRSAGTTHMAILRSPYPHARILSIDVSTAMEMPGVIDVISGEEVAGLVPPQEGTQEGEGGPPAHVPLAVGVALFVGDGVAAVLAEERSQAEDALETIVVEWEELPGVGDPERAMEPGSPRIQEYAEHNIDDRKTYRKGDTAAAFATAATTVSVRMVEQRMSPNPMEPRGMLATYEAGGDKFTIWDSTQCAQFVRDAVCDALKIPHSQVRVIVPEVGGGFGCKIGAYSEEVLVAYLARKHRRPVKWIENRSEHFQATVQGRSQIAYLDLAADGEGHVTALKLRLISDSGAYGAGWAAETSAGMITGCYDISNVETEAITVLTNKTPLGAYRGAGRPESAYYIERAMDVLAAEMKIDPIELRRRNFIAPEAFPHEMTDFATLDTGEYAKALDAALDRSEYGAMRAEQERLRAEGRVIGVGMASYVEVCGFGWETSTVRMESDATVSVYTGIQPHGQGQETTFSQMAADVLGVQPERVNVLYGDTALGSGFGTMGSRGTAVGGPAVHRAALQVQDKMRQIAARMMEASPDDLELEDGAWRVRGVPDRAVSVAEVADRAYSGRDLPEGMEPGLVAVNNFRPENLTAPFGTHVCMVEIDRETGKVEVLKYLTVDDCGTIISPTLVRGQVQGGTAQGISQALYEEVVYSEDGRLLSGSLVDYAIPSTMDLPNYETSHTFTASDQNELGVKGIGEAATIGSTPTTVNAVLDALSPFGIRHLDMPFHPQKVWQAMQQGA
ncbi:MAG: xanthine dehydrogenase family protein molybdopterin-binding subunit [Chloroflexota bacterium]